MNRSTLVLAAATLDLLLGDPESLPHPVRLIGATITHGEVLLYPRHPNPRKSFLAGTILTATVVGATYALAYKATSRRTKIPHAPGSPRSSDIPGLSPAQAHTLQAAPSRGKRLIQSFLTILLASTTLAARNLDDEARAILRALDAQNLPLARTRLARIVGRDTATLTPAAIHRALIETLAESLADGVVSPLFYLALGGAPAALTFKAVSTLDSMIGHCTPRYLYFGRAAARLDDAANFLPARLTALALLAAGRASPAATRIFLHDRHAHASPNAGHPEAAIAAVLHVQLGGSSTYDGEAHSAPLLNAGAPLPTLADAHRALRITRTVAFAITLTFAALLLLAERRNQKKRTRA